MIRPYTIETSRVQSPILTPAPPPPSHQHYCIPSAKKKLTVYHFNHMQSVQNPKNQQKFSIFHGPASCSQAYDEIVLTTDWEADGFLAACMVFGMVSAGVDRSSTAETRKGIERCGGTRSISRKLVAARGCLLTVGSRGSGGTGLLILDCCVCCGWTLFPYAGPTIRVDNRGIMASMIRLWLSSTVENPFF